MARFNFMLYYYPDKSMGKSDTLFHRLDYRNRSYNNENVVLLRLELLVAQVIKGIVFEDEE